MPNPLPSFEDMTSEQRLFFMGIALNDIQTKVTKDHRLLVEGNGELPLIEKVRNLEAYANSTKFWLRTVAVAIVVQTVTFGAAAIIYFVKLYPILSLLLAQSHTR